METDAHPLHRSGFIEGIFGGVDWVPSIKRGGAKRRGVSLGFEHT